MEESIQEGGLASHPTHFITLANSRGVVTCAGGAGSLVEKSFQEGGRVSHPTHFTTHADSGEDVTCAGGAGGHVEESFQVGGCVSHPNCLTTHSGGDVTCAGSSSGYVEDFQEGEGCCMNHPTRVTTGTFSGIAAVVWEKIELFGEGGCTNFQLLGKGGCASDSHATLITPSSRNKVVCTEGLSCHGNQE